METNLYAAPQAELEAMPRRPPGPVMPFEDPVAYPSFLQRILETLRWLCMDLGRAGQGLGGSRALGAPLGFYALLGLLPTEVLSVAEVLHPVQAIWQVWLGAARPAPPSGGMLVFMLLNVLIAGPIGVAIGLLLAGLGNHVGLWVLRGTRENFGLLVTFRTLLYGTALVTLATLPFHVLGHLPGPVGSYLLLPVALLPIAGLFYQGALLARAHRTETWRGILGVWLPVLVLSGLAAACLGALWLLAGETFQRAVLQGLRGGR